MASLLFAFRHIQRSGDIGQVGEFENRDAERASRGQAPWRRRMPLFVCLFVVCSGRFVATSVRYLTLFSRSRVFSQPPIISFSVFIFLSFYYSSCLPFYLPLFVSPLPNRSAQIYTPVEWRWEFSLSSIPLSSRCLLCVPSPALVDDDRPEARFCHRRGRNKMLALRFIVTRSRV